nr:reverse transcriptase domain-containing protein [Tanacetum cinerariifolium]
MDRFMFESSHIKGVPPFLCISAFMHGHGHPELAKKVNNKIPKTVDEMFKRVTAFIRGEVVAGSVEMNNQKNGSQGRNNVKVINMIRHEGNLKRPFEGERSGLTDELTVPSITWNQLTDEPIILEGRIEVHQVRRILVDGRSSSEIMFLRRNVSPFGNNRPSINYGRDKKEQDGANGVCDSEIHSPYNFIIGRTRMRSLRAWRQREEQISRIKEQAILRTKSSSGHGLNQGLVLLEKACHKENTKEILAISQERIKEHITIGITLSRLKMVINIRALGNIEVFAWARSERTTVSRFVMEHQLKIYPLTELVVHNRRPMTPDRRHALNERVFRWLKEGTIRKVQHLEWAANTIHVKLANGIWKGLVQDIEETLRKLKRVNIKIDPNTSSFGVEEGKFLGHVVTKEGVRADPKKYRQSSEVPPQKSKPNTKFIPAIDNHRYEILVRPHRFANIGCSDRRKPHASNETRKEVQGRKYGCNRPIPHVSDHISSKNLKLQNRSVNGIGNHKVRIPQPRNFNGNQDKAVDRSRKSSTQDGQNDSQHMVSEQIALDI